MAPRKRTRALGRAATVALFIAFAFDVMADPVSSVAYAIEAALRSLGGNLGLLFPTMMMVIGIIAIVSLTYLQIIGRFPKGGGAAGSTATAFGEAWAFIPIGALIVDFLLTITISVAASASAIIAWFPHLAGSRTAIALLLLAFVGGLTWFGHRGRSVFAAMTLLFIVVTIVALVRGFGEPSVPATMTGGRLGAVLLSFPVAMALATGVEAPSTAIAQLGQLTDRGRVWFGRLTVILMVVIVGILTFGLTGLAVRLGIGIPAVDSTQIADIIRAGHSSRLFAVFQLATALLLLSAASSSLQAGPGMLKAMSRAPGGTPAVSILPAWLGRINRHYTPYRATALFVAAAALLVFGTGGRDQVLVLFYAVAVFLSFLFAMLAMARISIRNRRWLKASVNGFGAAVVAFTLVVNLLRGYPLVALGAALLIAGGLYVVWVAEGRPRGVAKAATAAHLARGRQAAPTAPAD